MVYLYGMSSTVLIDSVESRDGKFLFEGQTELPRLAAVSVSGMPPKIIILENQNISITGKISDRASMKITGSPYTDKYDEFELKLREIRNKRDSKLTQEENDAIRQESEDFIHSTIKNNRDNPLGILAFATFYRLFSPEELLGEIGKFSPDMQRTEVMVYMKSIAEAQSQTAVGKKFTDIELTGTDGKPVKLSDYAGKGKYIFVDFWASWCGACLYQTPHLVEQYNQYKDKGFIVFGVSLDEKEEPWKKAIAKHKMDWIHGATFEGWDSSVVKDYGISQLPVYVLIAPDGTIVAKNEELIWDKLDNKLLEIYGGE